MAEPTTFPYETRLNILYGPLELIDVKAMSENCEYKWFNQTLGQVNGSVEGRGQFTHLPAQRGDDGRRAFTAHFDQDGKA